MKPKTASAERAPRSDVTLSLDEALSRIKPLARLADLLRDSAARYDAIRPLLPAALARHVRPGPVDELGWTLLVANAAVAAKLRQLKPRLEQALQERGWVGGELRIKIHAMLAGEPS
jgi:hypothetical protein